MGKRIKRYPSIRAFQRDEASLFIGRDKETRKLFSQVVNEKIVLLFARSGIGKSSLINAGLVPILEQRGLLPVYIRLSASDKKDETPSQIFRDELSSYLDQGKYSRLKSILPSEPPLWEYMQCCVFPLASTPVFIFDQFEQFFSFKPNQQEGFLIELNEVLADTIPPEKAEFYHFQNRVMDFGTFEQPDVHVLFAIRSDKIFEMNRLVQFLPRLLRSRFELYPLEPTEAEKAIIEPAAKKNPLLYISPLFTYEDKLVKEIVARLKGSNGVIETTQLQIICSEIEDKIILNPQTGEPQKPEGYVVRQPDIKGIGGLERIIANFYDNQIAKVGDNLEQELAKRLIEDNLYDSGVRNRRIIFKEAVLKILATEKTKLGKSDLDIDKFIATMLGLRLIREDYRENKKFYEISHDYLLRAIGRSSVAREAERLQKRNDELVKARRQAFKYAILSMILMVLSAFFLLDATVKNSKLKKTEKRIQQILTTNLGYEAEQRYAVGDKILAYAIWDTARNYSSNDTIFRANLQNRYFPPFTGTTLKADLAVSDNQHFIGTRYTNSQFMAWKYKPGAAQIDVAINLKDVKYFSFLPKNRILVVSNLFIPAIYEPDKNTTPKFLPDTGIASATILKDAGLLMLNHQNSQNKYFYNLQTLAPLNKLSNWWNDQIGRSNTRIKANTAAYPDMFELLEVNKDILLVVVNSNTYYVYTFADNTISKPRSLYLPGKLIVGNYSKSIAFNTGRTLALLDIESGNMQHTAVKIGEYDVPVSFFDNDRYLLINHYLSEEDEEGSGFSIHNVNDGKLIFRSPAFDRFEFNKDLGWVAYLDNISNFHLFDFRYKKVIYQHPSVLNFKFYDDSPLVCASLPGNQRMVISPYNKGVRRTTETGRLPLEIYGENFYKFLDPNMKNRKQVLEFRDTVRNNIQYLKSYFRPYLNREIKKIIGN